MRRRDDQRETDSETGRDEGGNKRRRHSPMQGQQRQQTPHQQLPQPETGGAEAVLSDEEILALVEAAPVVEASAVGVAHSVSRLRSLSRVNDEERSRHSAEPILFMQSEADLHAAITAIKRSAMRDKTAARDETTPHTQLT
jgi:hypothetical protein